MVRESKPNSSPADNPTARINVTLRGEPARILHQLKQLGVIRSSTDAVNQGLLLLWTQIKKQLEEKE